MANLSTDVLIVGGGTGGTAAALQAARAGVDTILVSDGPWLGGMLTAAGVSAPDGNELLPFQTGIWGAFLRELDRRSPLSNGWVSCFTYEPKTGAAIFAEWVEALPNLRWIAGQVPRAVRRQGDRVVGVTFKDFSISAQITIDATELGDLLSLGEVPYRWGWEWQSQFEEPSAPTGPTPLTVRHPVQSPTWVVVMQDYGEGAAGDGAAPEIPAPPHYDEHNYTGAWDGYGPQHFLNYGRLPQQRFMINWPQRGNDYSADLDRLVESGEARQQYLQEARWYAQGFAHFIQSRLGRRYGLAEDSFPPGKPGRELGGGAYALQPYYRESRRLEGLTTLREQDILPTLDGVAAALPLDPSGTVESIAVGNYANDHHYAGDSFPVANKTMRWGGRNVGTPFSIPYRCLVPQTIDGLLVAEKNLSVSHIANGATRLQPVVLGIGQAAGMAAALCCQQRCQPRKLSVRSLQEALLTDATAPAAVVPVFDNGPHDPQWRQQQRYFLDHPDRYSPADSLDLTITAISIPTSMRAVAIRGRLRKRGTQRYDLILDPQPGLVSLITLVPQVNARLQGLSDRARVEVVGQHNPAGGWFLVESVRRG